MAVAKSKQSTAGNSGASRSSYGWLPDFPDQRDHLYRVLRPVLRELPAVVDLRPQCSAIEDQGNLGSCTANAWDAWARSFKDRSTASVLLKSCMRAVRLRSSPQVCGPRNSSMVSVLNRASSTAKTSASMC